MRTGHTLMQQAMLRKITDGDEAVGVMLRGRTKLSVTKATVVAALQMYLDATFKAAHVVVDVALAPNIYDGSAFTVDLDDGTAGQVETEPART